MPVERALRIGVGGPVGSGKSSLIAALCGALSAEARLGVVTNDIYTTEDAEFLRSTGVLPEERIGAVQTGGCGVTPFLTSRDSRMEQGFLAHSARIDSKTKPARIVMGGRDGEWVRVWNGRAFVAPPKR